ncbi:MAG TPA: hypothetical protein VNN77_00040 [candidate division Zixibacteria bacterium]|nr:hypothetical protein [candidate division Zixibacteria bacterium]
MPYVYGYGGALRCIGQALERQEIVVFDLKSYACEFRLECGDPRPPYARIVRLSYSVADLERLEAEGRARRRMGSSPVDFGSLPEILRAVGSYIDHRSGHLLRVCNARVEPVIEVEYETMGRRLQHELLPLPAILEASTRMHQKRVKAQGGISSLGPLRKSHRSR